MFIEPVPELFSAPCRGATRNRQFTFRSSGANHLIKSEVAINIWLLAEPGMRPTQALRRGKNLGL
jgi:hypothetical protein